ncbi:MAG: hypothetical protein V4625_03765 [Pseudomonadota bacterium]
MQAESVVLLSMGMAVLGFGGFGIYRFSRRKAATGHGSVAKTALRNDRPAPDDSEYQVSYAPPEFEWSGNSTGSLPVKTLTYKQYECLEDARYGFRIVGLPPTERHLPQPHKTRAHSLKTVASLSKHGFLKTEADGGHTISDMGLNALAVCSVRY